MSAPLRKVKPSLRKHRRTKADSEESLSNAPEHAVEAVSSPKKRSCRTSRSSQRGAASQRMLSVKTVARAQRDLEKASTRRSNKPTHNTSIPSVRQRGRAVVASPESPTTDEQELQQQTSDDEISIKRKKGKRQYRKRGGKSETSLLSPASQASEISEDSEKKVRKISRISKSTEAAQPQRKCSKMSPPVKPLPKSTQPRKKHNTSKGYMVVPQDENEDEWTEEELMKLRE